MSATDRELLELAARAAGIKGRYFWSIDDAGIEMDGGIVWNPLYDDGAALRLAVKLEMQVCIGYRRIDACITSEEDGGVYRGSAPKVGDWQAATRRAIVEASAAFAAAQQTQGSSE